MKPTLAYRSTSERPSLLSTLVAFLSKTGKILLFTLLTMSSAAALAVSVNVSVSPGTISPGGSAVISWSSSGAQYCEYQGYTGPTSGSVAVSPSSSKTYTLRCYSPFGGYATGSATVIVQQPPPPPSPSVSAWLSPGSVYTGAASTLHWSSSNASSCNYGGTSGSTSVGPYSTSGTRSFTVNCSGPGGSDSSTAYLGVSNYPSPAITLLVSPSTIAPGEQVTWTWTTSYASSCSVDGQSVSTSGSFNYSYTQLGTHSGTLTCSGQGGTSSKTKSITVVQPENDPPVVTLSLSDTSLYVGESASLTGGSYFPTNYTGEPTHCAFGGPGPGVTVDGTGLLQGNTLTVTPTSPGTYSFSLTCGWGSGPSNYSSSDSETVVFTATNPPAPPAVDLTVSPSSQINLGQSAQLSLATTNTASCSFSGAFGSGPYPAENGSAVTVTPTAITEYTYTATCQNSVGQTATDSVFLNVIAEPPPPPGPPVQLSAGFDELYQARVGDFNTDGLTDIYIALDLSVTGLPGVEGFYLLQNSGFTFSLLDGLSAAQHALGEQAPLVSSQVELYAEDLDGNNVNDLFLRNLSSAISGVDDVLVFASTVDGDPPTGFVEADEEFVSFFTQAQKWLSQPEYIMDTVIANDDIALTPVGSPQLGDWRLDYLTFVGYGTGLDGLTPYVDDTSDIFDPLADIFGCNDAVAYEGFNSFCYFQSGVWWVTRTAQEYEIDIDFGDFNQDVIELIYPDSSTFNESGILRSVLNNGVVLGSSAGVLLESVLSGVLGGNPVFADVLGGAVPWPGTGGTLPDINDIPQTERKWWVSSGIARLFMIIGSLVTPGNIADNWNLYHYANAEKYGRVVNVQGGLIPGSATNVIFFTPDIYPTGWLAKECLALPNHPPIGYWTFRQEDEVIAVPSPLPVQEANFDAPPPIGDGLGYGNLEGGGNEWTSGQPLVSVTAGRPFIQIAVGIRPLIASCGVLPFSLP